MFSATVTRLRRLAPFLVCVIAVAPTASASEDVQPPAGMLDLTRAVVVIPPTLSGPELKAVNLLVEDVTRRSGVKWRVVKGWTGDQNPVVAIGPIGEAEAFAGPFAKSISDATRTLKPEGYSIRTEAADPAVLVAGRDARGVLFGVGRLLRELRTTAQRVLLPASFNVATSPAYPLRGHQLGYRPKTNSYDAWDLPRWDRYIRDLVIFGTNAVELIPPRSDDDADSPHFPRPPMEMMVEMSRLLDEYGLDVWIWYPAMDRDYSDPATASSALKEWGEVFRQLPRVDAVFVPGGDPGHTEPRILMPFLARVAEVLHRSHPKAGVWVSPQGFTQDWLDQFLAIMKEEPSWLAGVVHGPQIRIEVDELRKAIPARYPIRTYPDITHSQQCQFPVPDWDLAFSLTEGREVINPRPRGQATIFRHYQPGSIGFISYSEGCNDDVNKFVWSGLGWDPMARVEDILEQYARAFISEELVTGFVEGLLALERNWVGPLLTNAGVDTTLGGFRKLEGRAGPSNFWSSPEYLTNWRFQQALYRAYYDYHVRDRLIEETHRQSEAEQTLARYRQTGTRAALVWARSALNVPPEDLRSGARPFHLGGVKHRVRELADDLFVSIRMQLSVALYDAIAVDRGANIDSLDVPLSDRLWYKDQLARIAELPTEAERAGGIEDLLHRTDPGPGGFYDDLGNLTKQPHLVRGPGFEKDPSQRRSSIVGFGSRAGWPLAWCQNAQMLYDGPLQVHYPDLDREARYKVRVVYAGDSFRVPIRLDADDKEVHGWFKKPNPPVPVEFDVPAEATADGKLTLSWRLVPGIGGNGRGCQVAEVWLIRKNKDGR